MRALVYLASRRFANSLRSAFRNPRVLLPFVFMAAIVLLVSMASLGVKTQGARGMAPPFTSQEFVTGGPGALIAAIRSVLLVSLFTSVVTALGQGAVFFQPSDIDFLFPSPLSRRSVLALSDVRALCADDPALCLSAAGIRRRNPDSNGPHLAACALARNAGYLALFCRLRELCPDRTAGAGISDGEHGREERSACRRSASRFRGSDGGAYRDTGLASAACRNAVAGRI